MKTNEACETQYKASKQTRELGGKEAFPRIHVFEFVNWTIDAHPVCICPFEFPVLL